MILPRGKSIKQLSDTARVKMVNFLQELVKKKFSGYLAFDCGTAESVLCYTQGRPVAALWQQDGNVCRAHDAVQQLFRTLQQTSCQLQIFRLSPELVAELPAVCHGEPVVSAQLVDVLDIERLLERLGRDSFTGSLRLRAPEQSSLIFYREGHATGFFEDGSEMLLFRLNVQDSPALDADCLLDVIRAPAENVELPILNLEKEWLSIWRELNP